MEQEKIRVHKGMMTTKYGTDHAFLYDDPLTPQYTTEAVIERLMETLDYTPSTDNQFEGFFDGDCNAFFNYEGYTDIVIPESIVQRIKNAKR